MSEDQWENINGKIPLQSAAQPLYSQQNIEHNDNQVLKEQEATKRWNKIREAVIHTPEYANSSKSSTNVFLTYNNDGTPSTSKSAISLNNNSNNTTQRPVQRNILFNPFARSQQENNHHTELQNNFIAATISAAQAAGMTNYGRHFGRQLGDASKIYATTTAVQQDIYRLERDLEKILLQNSNLNRHTSFCTIPPEKLFNNNNTPNIDTNFPENIKHVTSAMSSVLETIKKHKLSNHLPKLTDILNMLTFPFIQSPIIGKNNILIYIYISVFFFIILVIMYFFCILILFNNFFYSSKMYSSFRYF